MITLEVAGRVVEVDDSFKSLSPEQQQKEVESIAASFAPSEAPEKTPDAINPLWAAGAGSLTGLTLGPGITAGTHAVQARNKAINDLILERTGGSGAAPGQKWAAKTGFGAGPGETVREVSEEFQKTKGPIGSGKISSRIAQNQPLTIEASQRLAAEKAAEEARFAKIREAERAAKLQAVKGGSTAGKFFEAAAMKPVFPWLGRALAGGATGFDVADAINRAKSGDITGAAISGLGALGGAASFVPTPMTRIGGTGVSILANLLNQYRARQTAQPQPQAPQMAYGGLVHLAKGGHATAAWQRKEGQNPEGGLNAAGRASYHAETGGTLKPPVSAKEAKSSPKKAARRKSFCARMSGMPGPMKDESGKPTRKALALRKWDC